MTTLAQVDVVSHVENEFRTERVRLAQLTDRVDALRDLRELLFEFVQRNGRPLLTVEAMWRLPRDETERARLVALVDRALPDTKES